MEGNSKDSTMLTATCLSPVKHEIFQISATPSPVSPYFSSSALCLSSSLFRSLRENMDPPSLSRLSWFFLSFLVCQGGYKYLSDVES